MRSRRILTAAVLLLASATSSFAAVDEVRLYLEGLACPFCTFGIEKKLKKVPGVSSVETTIRTGLAQILMEPDVPLDPVALADAVKQAGFTLSRIEATITGKLSIPGDDEDPVLLSSGTGQTFRLVQPAPDGAFGLLDAETREKLKLACGDDSKLLVVSGRVHSHVSMSPALQVESFETAR